MPPPALPLAQTLVVGNLRRQLKESFGAPAAAVMSQQGPDKDSLNPSYHYSSHLQQLLVQQKDSLVRSTQESSLIYNTASEMELNVDFLTEYAQRKDLASLGPPSATTSTQEVHSVMIHSDGGKAVVLTEDKFRAGMTDTLKKNRAQSSDMGDSGICSPPPLKLVQSNAIAEHKEHAYENLEEGLKDPVESPAAQPSKQQKKPPDTMIRELKSKLKQRQIRTSAATTASASPKNDRKSNNLLEVYESSIFDDDEEEDDVTTDLPSPPPPSAVVEGSAQAISRSASSADTRNAQMPRSE